MTNPNINTTVRISARSLSLLRELSDQEQLSQQAIIDKAIEAYRRKRLLEKANEAFAALRADPIAWKEELEERKLWEGTLADGLEEDEEEVPQ